MTMLGALGTMVCGWGTSMVVGVLLPYPSSPPGTNPMKDKSASSSNAMIAMTVAMLAIAVPLLPAIGVGVWGVIVGSLALTVLAGVLAVVAGVVLLLAAPVRIVALDRGDTFRYNYLRLFGVRMPADQGGGAAGWHLQSYAAQHLNALNHGVDLLKPQHDCLPFP